MDLLSVHIEFSTKPSGKETALKSPLLRLPAKLRNSIYYYVVGGHTIERIERLLFHEKLHGSERQCAKDLNRKFWRHFFVVVPRETWCLAAVSRQLYKKTMACFYTLKAFTTPHGIASTLGKEDVGGVKGDPSDPS